LVLIVFSAKSGAKSGAKFSAKKVKNRLAQRRLDGPGCVTQLTLRFFDR
jgi:hypothetical protein